MALEGGITVTWRCGACGTTVVSSDPDNDPPGWNKTSYCDHEPLCDGCSTKACSAPDCDEWIMCEECAIEEFNEELCAGCGCRFCDVHVQDCSGCDKPICGTCCHAEWLCKPCRAACQAQVDEPSKKRCKLSDGKKRATA